MSTVENINMRLMEAYWLDSSPLVTKKMMIHTVSVQNITPLKVQHHCIPTLQQLFLLTQYHSLLLVSSTAPIWCSYLLFMKTALAALARTHKIYSDEHSQNKHGRIPNVHFICTKANKNQHWKLP